MISNFRINGGTCSDDKCAKNGFETEVQIYLQSSFGPVGESAVSAVSVR
jgi:hypothetical protein